MIRAVALDFDGVVLESVDVKTQAFRELFVDRPEHLPAIERLHLENTGVSRYEKFRTIYRDYLDLPLDEREIRRLDERFSELVVEGVIASPFVEGAREFIERHADDLTLFVVSATPQEELREIIRRRDLNRFFAGALGSPGTKSELLRMIMDKHGLHTDELLFVGDASADYTGAAEAGVAFIGRVRAGSSNPFPAHIPVVTSLRELDATWGSTQSRSGSH